jgi:hypothetical protein
MNNKAGKEGVKEESYDYDNDFKVLPRKEKRGLVKNAKTLLKLQRENALLADAPAPPIEVEAEKGKGLA